MTGKSVTTTLKSKENSQALVDVSVAASLIASERQETVSHLSRDVTIKGFRKGKAPLSLVEDKLDPKKITDHILQHLSRHILASAFKDHSLEPLGYPKLKVLKIDTGEDWQFELIVPLKPEIKLGDYKKAIQTLLHPQPSKTKKAEDSREQKLKKIVDLLLETISFAVPPLLIEEQVEDSLLRLLEQIQTLNLKLDDYLKNINKTVEQLREEYAKTAQENLKIELILQEIAIDLKIEVPESEISAFINASGTDATREKLDTSHQRRHINAILTQRKTIDALLSL